MVYFDTIKVKTQNRKISSVRTFSATKIWTFIFVHFEKPKYFSFSKTKYFPFMCSNQKMTKKLKISRFSLHYVENPALSSLIIYIPKQLKAEAQMFLRMSSLHRAS